MKLLLTDFYHQATRRFLSSLSRAEIPYQHVNINYNGFLSNEILNPFAHLIGAVNLPDKALHYNQIKVPEFYEIRNLNGAKAEILQGDNVMGYIYYAAHGHRLVREVVWLNRKGIPTMASRYNRQGFKYADVLYNFEGKEAKILYFNAEGQKVLTMDMASRVVITENQVFLNLAEFVKDYLQKLDFDYDEILINSLSTPFFVTNQLPDQRSSLYFQETIRQEIPGNMAMIMEGKTPTARILFENATELEKVKKLAIDRKADLAYLGAIENFKRQNTFRPSFLTITRSDQILYDEAIAETLEKINAKWTIAAPSEVSDKLRSFATKYRNVAIMEAIRPQQVQKLFSDHDIYLDFNQGTDWENVVERAYLEGMLVISDMKTAKNSVYEFILDGEEVVRKLLKSEDKQVLLNLLHEKKGQPATKYDYQRILS